MYLYCVYYVNVYTLGMFIKLILFIVQEKINILRYFELQNINYIYEFTYNTYIHKYNIHISDIQK
jgi:hypothetical protein